MNVAVGMSLRYKGKSVICTSIADISDTVVTQVYDKQMRDEFLASANVTCLDLQICPFNPGDIITITQTRITLEAPGQDTYYIFSKFHVTKEEVQNGTNECERTSGGDGQASDDPAQSTGTGD